MMMEVTYLPLCFKHGKPLQGTTSGRSALSSIRYLIKRSATRPLQHLCRFFAEPSFCKLSLTPLKAAKHEDLPVLPMRPWGSSRPSPPSPRLRPQPTTKSSHASCTAVEMTTIFILGSFGLALNICRLIANITFLLVSPVERLLVF
jgi:hypothetical protein